MKLNEAPNMDNLVMVYQGKHYQTWCNGLNHYLLTDRGTWYSVESHEIYKDHR